MEEQGKPNGRNLLSIRVDGWERWWWWQYHHPCESPLLIMMITTLPAGVASMSHNSNLLQKHMPSPLSRHTISERLTRPQLVELTTMNTNIQTQTHACNFLISQWWLIFDTAPWNVLRK
jgi:hypothetical protein